MTDNFEDARAVLDRVEPEHRAAFVAGWLYGVLEIIADRITDPLDRTAVANARTLHDALFPQRGPWVED